MIQSGFEKDVEVIQVVRTTLLRRGDGKSDPVRRITQFWSLDGDLLAEVDPLPEADSHGQQRTSFGRVPDQYINPPPSPNRC